MFFLVEQIAARKLRYLMGEKSVGRNKTTSAFSSVFSACSAFSIS
jgi:hypothetical protein